LDCFKAILFILENINFRLSYLSKSSNSNDENILFLFGNAMDERYEKITARSHQKYLCSFPEIK
jgi:hypothetical protein